jgi:hypothetical protein
MSMKLRILDGVALTLWVGSLWTVGYLAVPILFQAQPDKQLAGMLAGMLAGEMFRMQGFVGIACGIYLMLRDGVKFGKLALRQPVFLAIALMLIITLAIQFGIQPLMAGLKSQALPLEVMKSPLADSFAMWHGISSILYLVESLLGASLVALTFRNK